MYTFLLVVHVIIAAALVGVILMQRSEGGGLTGGSPGGLMSARGAGDFLTRATAILAVLFVLVSIGLAALATIQRGPSTIDTSLSRKPGTTAPATTPAVPTGENTTGASDAPAPSNSSPVPLAVPATPAAPALDKPVTTETKAPQAVVKPVPEKVAPKPTPKVDAPKPVLEKSKPTPTQQAPKAVETPSAPAPTNGDAVVPPGLIPETK
jgi:preprotein translocase subunit SecG